MIETAHYLGVLTSALSKALKQHKPS